MPYERLGFFLFGTQSTEVVHSRLKLINSLMGKVLFSTEITSARIDEESCTIIQGSRKTIIGFEKCYVFNHLGIDFPTHTPLGPSACKVRVVGFFEGNNMLKSYDFSSICTGDEFISYIYPHNSGRVAGSKYVTDFYTESLVDQSALDDFDFSETMARFKLSYDLKQAGYKGTFSGNTAAGERKYSNIVLDHKYRNVFSPSLNYENSENVFFMDLTFEEVADGKKE